MVKGKFAQPSKGLEIWLVANFFICMSFILALIGKHSQTLARIYFIFLKKCPRPNLKCFNTKFGPQWKDPENNYQVREILAFFRKCVALILS